MLHLKNISKSFQDVQALDEVDFQVQPGKILGLIGPNGSGKTTAFRIILNLMEADTGQVTWEGQPITENSLKNIGYLPEERGLFTDMTVQDQIIYFGQLNGMKKKDIQNQIPDWMDQFEVKGKPTDKIKNLSKGNQQKVQLIATLIHKPELIILDEPFSGLDPVNADLLVQGILQAKEAGSAIIFSSHNMTNVSDLCDDLVMLINGKQVLSGPSQEIRNAYGRTRLTLETEETVENLLQIAGVSQVLQSPDGLKHLTLDHDEVGEQVFDFVTRDGYVKVFNQKTPSLEEIFKMKVGESHE